MAEQNGNSNARSRAGLDASSDVDSSNIVVYFDQEHDPTSDPWETILEKLFQHHSFPWEYSQLARGTTERKWIFGYVGDEAQKRPNAIHWACALVEAHCFLRLSESPPTFEPKWNETPPPDVKRVELVNGEEEEEEEEEGH
ncbi:MAG: hypothetical protein Q9162_006786 [Coniocarpon cinnabarinum]